MIIFLLMSVLWWGLILGCYYYLDPFVPHWVIVHLSSKAQHIASIFSQVGEAGYWIVIFLIGFLLSVFAAKSEKYKNYKNYKNYFLYLLLTVLISGVICDVFKIILSRARPKLDLLNMHPEFGFYFFRFHAAYWSFPSGHSTTIASVFMGLALLIARKTQSTQITRFIKIQCRIFIFLFFILLSLIFSSLRVFALMHYPSDVLAGLYLGGLVSIGLFYLWSPIRVSY